MADQNGIGSGPSAASLNQVRLYRLVSISLCAAFVVVGLIFLIIPGNVILLFNDFSRSFGMVEAPVDGSGFYVVLSGGYMYVVSSLAWRMFRIPHEKHDLQVLIQAKSASAVLSILFFAVVQPYLIFLTNGLVDGSIAAGLIVIRSHWKGIWQ